MMCGANSSCASLLTRSEHSGTSRSVPRCVSELFLFLLSRTWGCPLAQPLCTLSCGHLPIPRTLSSGGQSSDTPQSEKDKMFVPHFFTHRFLAAASVRAPPIISLAGYDEAFRNRF